MPVNIDIRAQKYEKFGLLSSFSTGQANDLINGSFTEIIDPLHALGVDRFCIYAYLYAFKRKKDSGNQIIGFITMALEITGKVQQLLQEQTGSGRNGQWVRQDFIVETEEQYPRKICFSAWGDKVVLLKSLQKEDRVKISFHAESREYNGRWYTDLRIWRLEQVSDTQQASQAGTSPGATGISEGFSGDPGFEPLSEGDDKDDLPF